MASKRASSSSSSVGVFDFFLTASFIEVANAYFEHQKETPKRIIQFQEEKERKFFKKIVFCEFKRNLMNSSFILFMTRNIWSGNRKKKLVQLLICSLSFFSLIFFSKQKKSSNSPIRWLARFSLALTFF